MCTDQAVPVVVPELGAEDTVILLGQWLVDDGELVLEADRIIELLTEGVLFHLSSPAEGRIQQRLTETGLRVAPGTVLGLVLRPATPDVPGANSTSS